MVGALGGSNPCQDYRRGGGGKTKEPFASLHERCGVK